LRNSPSTTIRSRKKERQTFSDHFHKGGSIVATLGAVTLEDWARVWAHAWLESDFRKMLRQNPANAVAEFNKQFPQSPLPHTKIFDLEMIYSDLQAMGVPFETMPDAELNEIAEHGTWKTLPFCLQPNEWVIVP
jgi:hypothetical protein